MLKALLVVPVVLAALVFAGTAAPASMTPVSATAYESCGPNAIGTCESLQDAVFVVNGTAVVLQGSVDRWDVTGDLAGSMYVLTNNNCIKYSFCVGYGKVVLEAQDTIWLGTWRGLGKLGGGTLTLQAADGRKLNATIAFLDDGEWGISGSILSPH